MVDDPNWDEQPKQVCTNCSGSGQATLYERFDEVFNRYEPVNGTCPFCSGSGER